MEGPSIARPSHLQYAFTKAADDSRARPDRYTEQDDADQVHPVRQDDQQAHRPQERPAAERAILQRRFGGWPENGRQSKGGCSP